MSQSTQPPQKNLRRQFIVMRKMQGQLLFRVMAYCCLSAACACLVCCLGESVVARVVEALLGGGASRPVVITAGLLLSQLVVVPIALYDAAKLSSKMFGPLVRAQGAIRRLGNEEVAPLAIRDESWSDWVGDFNVMLSRVQRQLGSNSGATP